DGAGEIDLELAIVREHQILDEQLERGNAEVEILARRHAGMHELFDGLAFLLQVGFLLLLAERARKEGRTGAAPRIAPDRERAEGAEVAAGMDQIGDAG